MSGISLVIPDLTRLAGYRDALKRGFSPDNLNDISRSELAKLDVDAEKHLAGLNGEPGERTITLPTGQKVPRLPMITRWIWDGEFSGVIKFRYQPNSNELPPYILGHVGYAVPEWKRGLGYATQALQMLLPLAKGVGVTELKITCDPDNAASQKVIKANSGMLMSEIVVPDYGDAKRLLFILSTEGRGA